MAFYNAIYVDFVEKLDKISQLNQNENLINMK